MADKQILEQALKHAKRAIYISSALMVVGIFFTIQLTYYPNAFTPASNITAFDTTAVDPTLMAMNLDPAEIENGIHMPTGLIVDDGVDMVIRTCGACHSLDLVTQNKADKNGWKDIIVWMQETQGLWDLGPTEDIIITYLAKNYAPEDTGRRKNLEDIIWYDL
ncbi:monoheme cytochrome C [Crocinitomix sp.]|nr:monoheme cytochrome C [Crocinitomix sp.]